MYKIARIGRYAPGVSKEDGRRRWSGPVAALGAAVPGVERYVQSHSTQSLGLLGVNDDPPKFDGYACVWFTDRDAYTASTATAEWEALAASANELFDVDWMSSMSAAVDERTIIDGPMGPFKAVWIVRFKDEIRADPGRVRDAHEYWTRTHGGAFGVKVPGIDRYVQNHVIEPMGDQVPEFDGFSECWFQDRAAFDVTMESQEWDDMNNDAPNLFDVDLIVSGMSALLDEIVIKG